MLEEGYINRDTHDIQYIKICKPNFDRLEDTIKEHTIEIQKMSKKVFNGYGTMIENLKIEFEKETMDNKKSHEDMQTALSGIIKFGATSLIMIFMGLIAIIGSIWATDLHKDDDLYIARQLETEQTYKTMLDKMESIEEILDHLEVLNNVDNKESN